MNAATVLARLRDLGIIAEVRGGGLALRPASAIPGELLAELKEHKTELLALLAANDRDAWGLTGDERAVQAAMIGGLLRAARQRPPSWSDPAALPWPGCFCPCRRGQRWWCERGAPKGWRCWACHPPDHTMPKNTPDTKTA